MATRLLLVNVRKYTLVVRVRGRWWVQKERIMGLSPLEKVERQKSVFTMAFLGFIWGSEEGSIVKSGNQNN